MATIDTQHTDLPGTGDEKLPLWQRYKHGHHWRNADDEFDAANIGIWLFLSSCSSRACSVHTRSFA